MNILTEKYGLSQATDVLFSGVVLALGVYWHANYVYEWILKLRDNKAFNYMAMPDAGYFLQVYGYEMAINFCIPYGNLTIGLDDYCVRYYQEWDGYK